MTQFLKYLALLAAGIFIGFGLTTQAIISDYLRADKQSNVYKHICLSAQSPPTQTDGPAHAGKEKE